MRKWFSLVLVVALLLAGTAVLSFGQGATAVIRGTVVDPSGAVVPQATVVARNVATGVESRAVSTAAGIYNFPNLPPGTYDVRVEKSGFTGAVAKAIHINVGDLRDQNFKLALAGTATEVTVTSEAPLIESTRTDVSTVVDERDMRNLPVSNGFGSGAVGASNDYAQLAATAPGVRYDFSGNSFDLIGPGSYSLRENVYNVDGGNITDQVVSGRDALGASLDEVQEFQVITNNYNAEYGQAGSLIVNVITKSGTNQFHGDGHAYFRGRNLSASNYFYNLGLTRPDLGCDTAPCPVDGARRAPFQKQEWGLTAGGPVVKDRLFWFGSFEQTHQSIPLVLTPPSGTITVSQPTKETLYSGKIDAAITTNNKLSLRANVQRNLLDNDLIQTPQTITPDSLNTFVQHDHTINGSLTSTITPHLVNEARVFWHRYFNLIPTKTTAPGVRGNGFYTGADFCCPQGGDQNRYQGTDNLTWTHGAHTFKTGVSMSYFPYISIFQQFHFGQYDVDSSGAPIDFVVGVGPGTVRTKDNIYGAYVQDTWKLRPNFTVNYGVRYDYEAGAFKGGPIKKPGVPGCFQTNGIIPACSSDKNNFQPRLGFTYSPGWGGWLTGGPNKTVISASFAEITQMAFLNVSLDSLNFDGFNLLTATLPGSAVAPFFPGPVPASVINQFVPANRTKFGRVRPISPNLRNPETRHANLSIRRELSPTTAIELDYIGVFGFGEFGESDTNFPTINADPAHPGFFFLGDRPDPRFTAIRTNMNTRTSHYNGGMVNLQRRLSSHVQFQANYTFSKTLSSAEDFYGTSEPADPRNIRAELAPSQSDVRHLANLSFVLDTTKLVGNSGWSAHFLNNWALAWTGTLQSGRPYPVSTGDFPFPGTFYPGIGSETQERPNVGPNGILTSTNIAGQGSNLLVSPAGAAICACPQTTFLAPAGASANGPIDTFAGVPVDFQFLSGNLGRNAGRGSPYNRLDFSISRGFQLGHDEHRRLEFKADFFNVLNHTNFLLFNSNDVLNLLPVGTLPSGAADPNCTSCLNAFTGQYIGANGAPLTINDLRHGIANGDKRNLLSPNWGGIGDPASADIPRQIQLSVRFRW